MMKFLDRTCKIKLEFVPPDDTVRAGGACRLKFGTAS